MNDPEIEASTVIGVIKGFRLDFATEDEILAMACVVLPSVWPPCVH